MQINIPFNKPFLTGKETEYIRQAVEHGKLSGNGEFTQRCQHWFEERYGFGKCLLTTSCTDALEMAAILADIKPGDEVIVPSYTFVSSALAFVRAGAKIIFADSLKDNPNIDVSLIEQLITPQTRVIVPVHYAGVACDMEAIMQLANKYKLIVVEDAAQAIDSFYKERSLGSIGHLAAFSFHETKNIISGEGGMLAINDISFARRAEIIWEKGTNRAEFFRGEVNKYGWVDTGSSFLPSEMTAAFLWAQIEHLDSIQAHRKELWTHYMDRLSPIADSGCFTLPLLSEYASNNAHLFYCVCNSLNERTSLISHLKEAGVLAVFHYLCLHSSPYYRSNHDGRILPNADRFQDCLVRLPLFHELTHQQIDYICTIIKNHFYNI